MAEADHPFRHPDARHERSFATLNLGAVAVFTAVVLLDGKVSPAAYLRLAGAYVAVSGLILLSAFILFAGQAALRGGIASRWKASPTALIRDSLWAKWSEDRMLGLLWPVATFTLLMPAFNAFKQRMLPEAGFHYDVPLAAADRALFGSDPGIWLHQAIGSPATTSFFDAIYHSWFVPTTLGVCIVGLCAGVRGRAQYMTAYTAVWILLGAVLAYLFPAAGPAFYEALVSPSGAASFQAVEAQLAAVTTGGGFLTSLHNQAYLLANLDRPELVVGGGISAIPSVHNAIAVLFALASFRIGRACGLAMSLFALLIWVASVYLNWHYAVDGLAGAAGAALLWFGAGWLVNKVMSGEGRAIPLVPAPAATL